MNNPLIKRLMSALIAVLLLIYVGYQIYNSGYTPLKTETAVFATMQDVAQTTGVAIRKETLIQQSSSGVITYTLGSGGKVSKNGAVAEIYDTAQAASIQQQVAHINDEIDRLIRLGNPGDTYAVNPDLLQKQIDQKFAILVTKIHNEQFDELTAAKDDFIYLVNQNQVVAGRVTDFSQRIANLQKQRDTILSGTGKKMGQITSPVSGYFIDQADGFENTYDYDAALSLMPNELKEKMNSKPETVSNDVIGKVSEEFDWYFACILSADTALKLNKIKNEGKRVYISMPFASTEAIPATVEAINQTDKNAEAAVIFKCNYMNDVIASTRNETVQIRLKEYSGIRVSQKSIYFETVTQTVMDKDGKYHTVTHENVRGVYVTHGSEVEFVQIFPLFSSGSYVICEVIDDMSTVGDELFTQRSIQLSDEVVVEGTDLYHGKVVK